MITRDIRTSVRMLASLSTMTPDGSEDTCDLLCLDLPKAEAVRARLPAPDQLAAWAGGAPGRSSDPTRLAIALALRDADTACVCDLAWIVGRDEKLVSHHVRAAARPPVWRAPSATARW